MEEIIAIIVLVLLTSTAIISLILQMISTHKMDKDMREVNEKYIE